MTQIRCLALVLGLGSAAAMVSCAGTDKPVAAAAPAGQVAVINTMCPIGGDDFAEKHRPPELAREWKGNQIGFCCSGCVTSWEKMDPAKRDQVLALAKQNKAP